LLLIAVAFSTPAWGGEGLESRISRLAGGGAVMAAARDGRILVAHNTDRALAPASILKIFTAAAALEVLGPEYRFETVISRTPQEDLVVSGRGDPHLVSEEIRRLARRLRSMGLDEVRSILVDAGYFQEGLVLHGTNCSLNPYDAYNGALCANFNTVKIKVTGDGRVVSAEPQTPLTPIAKRAASGSRVKGEARINLAGSPEVCPLYAGELIRAFLEHEGVRVSGGVRRARGEQDGAEPWYVHRSGWTMEDLVRKMFRYSNNFMANQIFLTMGAERFGPPATVEKARGVMQEYLEGIGITGLHVEEGSGLSRRTRVTAGHVIRVLEDFRPHRGLMECRQGAWCKTGTLRDVKSLAGYLEGGASFVIMLNGKDADYQRRDRLFAVLRACIG
jgi:D-alanyl-D-alanine carboxypeptidase/D-alanyl-D-alanine-endopeptidase (penicillin-binding protein 4)